MKKKTIIVDLDGTLCNIDHRMHLFRANKLDEFQNEMAKDTPNFWCTEIIWAMSYRYTIHYVTARSDDHASVTDFWVAQHSPTDDLLDHFILMKDSGDNRPDDVVKEEMYRQHIEPEYDVLFVIDDRQHVVDMWRRLGLTCLQCAKGDY